LFKRISRRYERQADRFAADTTGKPESMASALNRLAKQNLADPEPHPVIEFIFYSHPAIMKRVEALEKTN